MIHCKVSTTRLSKEKEAEMRSCCMADRCMRIACPSKSYRELDTGLKRVSTTTYTYFGIRLLRFHEQIGMHLWVKLRTIEMDGNAYNVGLLPWTSSDDTQQYVDLGEGQNLHAMKRFNVQ
ncbi:unnamed protein product [Protopolystoma xenopodis]|uniref:Uncharacterized protein n=1 Tax=Protopolystoma xenopodis TaxID=117903 RepID=A0A448XIM7_9PLAT|nr:unnamed protein product [Protopolystoma xenopodis]